ncbi:hypothetical protein [Myceligenerans crystallogenes]|uniref:RDD family protein n=1 Tax=Myceligenerans crystallogenes TaxID=316335 RepID=A0ABN2N341_9MICO
MRILLTAGRLLAAHWPALLALGFLGVAVRGAAFWGAIEVSKWNGMVAQIVLLALPLGILLPVIVMLRVCYPSLPNLARSSHGGGAGWGKYAAPAPYTAGGLPASSYDEPVPVEAPRARLVDVALSLLVPFLTVYAVDGTMDADHARFRNDVTADEMFSTDMFTGDLDFSARIGLLTGTTLLLVVAGLIVLRWALGLLERRVHFLGISLLAVAVETFWSTQAAYDVEQLINSALVSIGDLALIDWSVGTYTAATEAGQGQVVAEAGSAAAEWVVTVAESLDEVIIAPLGWLAIGTVVLGRQLMAPPSTRHPVLDQMNMPGGLRAVLAAATQEVRNRFSALWQGLKMIRHGGVGTMMVFCLAYLVVMRAPLAVGWLVRAITGPVETGLWLYVISPWELAAGSAIGLALAGALIAAAVDTMAGRGLAVEGEHDGELSDGEGAIPGTLAAR